MELGHGWILAASILLYRVAPKSAPMLAPLFELVRHASAGNVVSGDWWSVHEAV